MLLHNGRQVICEWFSFNKGTPTLRDWFIYNCPGEPASEETLVKFYQNESNDVILFRYADNLAKTHSLHCRDIEIVLPVKQRIAFRSFP